MPRVLPMLSDRGDWRMAGPGGFCQLSNGIIGSYGGAGLFWYAQDAFEDFVLTIEWRITHPDDNSGVFLRAPPLSTSPQPAIERGYEVQIDDRGTVSPHGARELEDAGAAAARRHRAAVGIG